MFSGINGNLWKQLEPMLADLGYELVDLDFLSGGAEGSTLRLFIDHLPPAPPEPGGKAPKKVRKVTVDNCAEVSRALSLFLDEGDLIDHSYTLEVSSPGMERRLRKADHFKRYMGREAKVDLLEKIDGRRRATGTIEDVDVDEVTLEVPGQGAFRFTLDNLKKAHLIVDFEKLFQHKKR